jgi:signal transduction histidine kinase
MSPAPEPVTRPSPAPTPPRSQGDVPALTWPLVERRQTRGGPRPDGLERRSDDVPRTAFGRLPTAVAPPLAPFRWAALAASAVVLAGRLTTTSYGYLVAAVLVTAYAAYRTARPIAYAEDARTRQAIVAEVALHLVIVVATGAWDSPFVFLLVPCVLLVGFSRGVASALRVTAVVVVVVSIGYFVEDDAGVADKLGTCTLWLAVLALVAILSGIARQVSRESARQQTLALDRLGRLAEANALLFSLHRVAQTLPASLDLNDVLDSTIVRLRDLIQCDSITVLLYEDSDRSWVPVRRMGNRDQATLDTSSIPLPLQRAMHSRGAVLEHELEMGAGPGLAPSARSGLYASLRARGALIGLIAVESETTHHYGPKEVELVNGLVEPLGTAIDNARWFSRLRSMGADEERSRIARDLHDQIGQSVAHLGFEIDRAVRIADRGDEVKPALEDVRNHIRSVVTQVRETLYDLRTDVSDAQDVGTTMQLFLDRVHDRSGVEVVFDRAETGRLPLLQEREMWRIAKEAVINAERHAEASTLAIRWRCDGRSAQLEVTDDGIGYSRSAARDDSYGLVGMRERATTIGARFDIYSSPGRGTTVQVVLDPEPEGPP